MNSAPQPISHIALTGLVAAGKIESCSAVGQRAGWYLKVKQGPALLALASEDDLKIFPTLSALGDYLRGLGITSFLSDTSELDQDALDPETKERLNEAKQAAEYGAWFRQQVQEALNDRRPTTSHSVVQEKFAKRRAASLKKLAKA
ncbi:hypothetical protein GTP44_14590 [Duganella sp. FT50W]|uniref:Uncharacterized protein n=1 Tax=Duganella lactea TaxID=2692173 RepID=A0A6L8MJ54_9BURK|nr:hypothetical protein [Duganella lactea]MYM83180.1 hypothetical protein [Duganella lactea]